MSDDVVWHCIRHGHCSFMAKIETGIFCRNPYNVTGICNRSSCPLANSRYATIRDHDGIFYLYMKTAERAHLPNKLWERVKLPRNYEKAIEVINKRLEFWPQLLVHKIKQRLTKMTQYRIRMRKFQLKVREKLMTVPRKKTQIGNTKERKADQAAKIDNCIRSELLERLKNGCYPSGIWNYPDKIVDLDEDVPEDEECELEYVEPDEIGMEMDDDMEDFESLPNGEDDSTDADHVLHELVEKKKKGSKIGKRSTKVMNELLEQDEDMDSRQRTLV
ncbi:unnamed protein product [Urochloa decumbens]|uniref:Protein MAK16 homolog n=1 Tax=Urochloa decumbens TaxID=240449 RepID=A0ABC9A0A0_9POAL